MVTYIVITNNKQNGELSTSKPFFSHEEAEKEMWNQFAIVAKMSVDEAKEYAKIFSYADYYINTLICECEIQSIIFREEDMNMMRILDEFYKEYPEFNDYKNGEWRAKFQDMLVYHINHLLPRYKKDWQNYTVEDFINEVLIGEELYEAAVAELGGDVNRTQDIYDFINENPRFKQIFKEEYGLKDAWMCGMLVLSNGDEKMVKEVRQAINEWCDEHKQTHIFVEPQYVYRVYGYYDMNIGEDEQIVQEVYATEELAKSRCKQLIADWKENGYTKEDSDEWNETDTHLWAYCDSAWNVDIAYIKVKVKTNLTER